MLNDDRLFPADPTTRALARQLFDAILKAEGVSPETGSASPATVERVRALTLQMFDFAGE